MKRNLRAWLVLVAFAGLTCPTQASEAPPLKLVQSIPLPGVKGRLDHFAIDSKGGRLFVAALGNNSLEVIDLTACKRVRSVVGMSKPTGVLYIPAGSRTGGGLGESGPSGSARGGEIMVANGSDGTVKILDDTGLKVVRQLAGVGDADNLRWDQKARVAWLGYGDGALGLIDVGAAKPGASIKLPGHPESFQLEVRGNRIFVNVPNAKEIAVIDRESRGLVSQWPMKKYQGNFPMALDEERQRLFIGCREPARLVVLDTTEGKPVAEAAISGDMDDLFYDASRKRLYVSCGEGFIDCVEETSLDGYKRAAKLPTARGARTSFFSPELDRLYLAVPERDGQGAEIRVYQPY